MASPDRLKIRFSSRHLKNLIDKLDDDQKGFVIKKWFWYFVEDIHFQCPIFSGMGNEEFHC